MTFSDIWSAYLWPLGVMVAQSLLLLVSLLIVIAYLLLVDRKIWAAVEVRGGPNVGGPREGGTLARAPRRGRAGGAEGMEAGDQASEVQGGTGDRGRGFLVARPMSAEQVAVVLVGSPTGLVAASRVRAR